MEWFHEAKRNWESVRKWILLLAGLGSFILLLRLFPSDFFSHYVGVLCEWVASMGYWAPFILGLIDAVGVAICFPLTLAFELAAGFLFGVVPGYVPIVTNPLICTYSPNSNCKVPRIAI